MHTQRTDRIVATLLGTAVGDSLGLPYEGLSRERVGRLCRDAPLTHRFLFGRGMVSDDSEHAAMTAQALIAAGDDEQAFASALAWRLRWWLAAMPAGVGWATLRATVRLWFGIPPSRSGVHSAGNGPLMRAPILGMALAHHPARLLRFVRASTRITHRDPRAEQAALAIAFAAAHAARSEPHQQSTGNVLAAVRPAITDGEFARKLEVVGDCLARENAPDAFAAAMGVQNGVSGFAPDSACAALFCWLRYPGNFREAVEAVIRLGGDTDSTAAIVGGLAGAALGTSAIPREWLSGLAEWPRTPAWLERVGVAVAAAIDEERSMRSVPLFWPALPFRNGLFLLIAIAHLLRRLLPPY